MLAAKIHSAGDSTSQGTKRPLEESTEADGSPEPKRINSKDSFSGAPVSNMQRTGVPNGVLVEEFKVPDKLVGLIIGRGGEQISRLQSESGCKVQLSHEQGHPERQCTLTGTREAITKAKDLLNQIISRGGGNKEFHFNDTGGQITLEVPIPGPKAGLIIGKGGENIKNMQEQAGVKMHLVQDNTQIVAHDKPLRITGDARKCEQARKMVLELLMNEGKEEGGGAPHRSGFKRPFNDFQGRGGGGGGTAPLTETIVVPKPAVGLVIGKGGETIKRIQHDSGARLHFDTSKDQDPPGDRYCIVTGNPSQVECAIGIINELIQSAMIRDSGMPPPHHGAPSLLPPPHHSGGRGRGRGGRGGGRGERGPPRNEVVELQYGVPSSRCGVVIGKGGESIRQIIQQSGAHVELMKGPPPNPHEKVFVIRGTQYQIDHAQQLINEKISGSSSAPSPGGGPASNHHHPSPHFHPPQHHHHHPPQPPQSYQPPPGPPPPAQPPQYHHHHHHPPQNYPGYQPATYQAAPPPVQAAAQSVVPTALPVAAAAPAPTALAAADPNKETAAAWAAYYAYYNQTPAPATIQPAAAQLTAAPVQTVVQPVAAAPAAQPAAAPAPAAAGQADYSAAWAEYYRSLGMYREAEMVEHARSAQSAAAAAAASVAPAQSYLAAPTLGQAAAGHAMAVPQQPTQIVATLPQPVAAAVSSVQPAVVASPSQWAASYSATPQATYVAGYGYAGYPTQ